METLIYLAKVNLYWVIFYICYRLFLHKHTFFVLNRTFLLCSLLMAIFLPAIHLPETTPIVAKSVVYIADAMPSYPSNPAIIAPPASAPVPLEQLILIAIGIGGAFMLAKLMHAFRGLTRVIKQGEVIAFEDHNLVLLPHNATGSFSFFKWLIINRNDYEYNLDLVLRHEITHIKQMHSWDIMFVEFLKIACWFNPVLWLYKHSLQEIHEFLADETAPNRERYATFLVSYGMTTPIQSLTNHFMNTSTLKNRITMIYKTRTSKWLLGKYAMIIPVILIIIISTTSFSSIKPVRLPVEKKTVSIKPAINESVSPNLNTEENRQTQSFDIQGVVLDQSGEPVSRALLLSGSRLLGKTDEKGQFQINGIETNSKISVSHVSFALQQFVTEKSLTNYKITLIRNETMLDEIVVVGYGVSKRVGETATLESAGPEPNLGVQKMPEFPGGQAEMYRYIAQKIQYPTEASQANIQGRVSVAFTVNENGNIRNPRIMKGLGGGTDEEALRVVLAMPKWTPAEQNGEKVSADYTISIKFALER